MVVVVDLARALKEKSGESSEVILVDNWVKCGADS